MIVIRLQRTGRRNSPAYRVVVAEKARPVKGKIIEILGHYLPTRDPIVLEFKQDRVEYWMSKGAIPSNTIARLLTKSGMKGLEKYIETYTKKKKRKEQPEEEAPAATPAPAEEKKEEAPKEEEKPAEEEKKEEKPDDEPPAEEKKEEPSSAEATEGKEDTGDKEEKSA